MQRLGVEHAHFNGFTSIERTSETWVYTTRAADDCPPSEFWATTSGDLPLDVVTGAAAVVLPPTGDRFVFPDALVVSVHESGWCAFHDGIVHDLGTGDEYSIDTSSVRWLDESL